MMSKTHIAMGAAAALLIAQPTSFETFAAAMAGGAVGAILPDIDLRSTGRVRDALYGRIIAAGIAAGFLIGYGVRALTIPGTAISIDLSGRMIFGVAALAILCAIGRHASHRGFTHSILFLLLAGCAADMISPALGMSCAVGILSHIVLDLFNKKTVRVLYPVKKGFCIGLCRADGLVNRILLLAGILLIIYAAFVTISGAVWI